MDRERVPKALPDAECLTGIPGSTGATPIQNVGAYGQEVASVIESRPRRSNGPRSVLTGAHAIDECGFGYRDSMFKRDPERFVDDGGVDFRLFRPGGPTDGPVCRARSGGVL